jgi:photosystem II stability/assembly factor-like uncharacterized protein
MKRTILILLLVVLNNSNLLSQTGWIEINTGFQRIITDVYFVSPNTGWAVGDSIIIKSTNGGLSWTRQDYNYLNIRTTLNSVRFINENTGFVAGGHHSGFYDFYYQYIFKTTDGGASWNLINNIQGGASSVITRIFPANQNHIFVSSAGSANSASSGGVMKSTNGGVNFFSFFTKGESNSLYCFDTNTAWVSFYYWTDFPAWKGYIYKTTNGGLNWFEQFKDSLYNSSKINSLIFVNQNTGFAVGKMYTSNKTRFFKTTNGGANWDTISYNNSKYNSVFFINASTGWKAGVYYPDSSCIDYTTNGGTNWIKQKKGTGTEITNLYFANQLTGWATIKNSSVILRTTTGGITFISSVSNEIPDKYCLFQNYPNPFNPSTNIRYQITNNRLVLIKIYDIAGKEIATLVNEKQSPGTYEVKLEAGDLPSGVYFYKLITGDYSETKKMILFK